MVVIYYRYFRQNQHKNVHSDITFCPFNFPTRFLNFCSKTWSLLQTYRLKGDYILVEIQLFIMHLYSQPLWMRRITKDEQDMKHKSLIQQKSGTVEFYIIMWKFMKLTLLTSCHFCSMQTCQQKPMRKGILIFTVPLQQI